MNNDVVRVAFQIEAKQGYVTTDDLVRELGLTPEAALVVLEELASNYPWPVFVKKRPPRMSDKVKEEFQSLMARVYAEQPQEWHDNREAAMAKAFARMAELLDAIPPETIALGRRLLAEERGRQG